MSKKHRSIEKEAHAPGGSPASGFPEPGCDPVPKGATPVSEREPGGDELSVQTDLAALTDRLLRLQADFDNYRKRVQRDQSDTYRRSLESILSDLLPVLDHFELGLQNAASLGVPESLLNGFKLVLEQLQTVLVRQGLSPIETHGQLFNPELHESIAVQPSNEPPDTILQQTRKGYRLGGQLLRPAQVVLAGLKSDTKEPDAPPSHANPERI
jgi:molecular chaperone GrpE